jgi:hypothetical protein
VRRNEPSQWRGTPTLTALFDANLSGQDTFAVTDILSERHIPFAFATGYGVDGVADRFRGAEQLISATSRRPWQAAPYVRSI